MLNILDVVEHKLKHEDDVYKCLTRKQLGKLLNKTKVIQHLYCNVL